MSEPVPTRAFMIGAPRSGTTWLQIMLGAHPSVVTPQELHLFSTYIPPLWRAWEAEVSRAASGRRIVGLMTALTEEEFESELQHLVLAVHRRVLAMKPGATLLLEKDPAYSHHLSLTERLVPEAKYIHLIRDGRDVATSVIATGKAWGSSWAPTAARRAAELWRDHVEQAQEAAAFTGRYLEVRYEDLLERGPDELLRVLEFLGLDADIAWCEQVANASSFSELAEGTSLSSSIALGGEALERFGRTSEPPGFFRSGRSGGWRSSMSARDLRVCQDVMGDLLDSLGYESAPATSRGAGLSPARVSLRLERVARGSARRIGRRLESWGAE